MRKFLTYIILSLTLTSCGEYQRVLKSNDANVKYEYAKRSFEQGKYVQAASVLGEIVTLFKGTEKAEETLFMLAMCNYENKDYLNSGSYFRTYYQRYPKGKYAEDSRFFCGYGYDLDSPDAQLDQSGTVQAIQELQSFMEMYPKSEKVPVAQNAIFEMQDKLTLKQLQNAQLYYNLGTYGGNNFQSAIIVAQNAIRDYPYSKYKEQLELLVLKARFKEAELSVAEKQADRYRQVVDEYYSFINEYPESAHRSEADNIYKIASRHIQPD